MVFASRNTGFTLVEVMVSLAIFLVASMALLPLLLTSIRANQENGLHRTARQLASQIMAEMQVVEYDRLGALAEIPLLAGEIEIRQHVESGYPRPGQSQITVSAHWQHQGTRHDYRLQTIRSAP